MGTVKGVFRFLDTFSNDLENLKNEKKNTNNVCGITTENFIFSTNSFDSIFKLSGKTEDSTKLRIEFYDR